MNNNRFEEVRSISQQARAASRILASIPAPTRTQALAALLSGIEAGRAALLLANHLDLEHARAALDRGELSASLFGRLKLDDAKLDAICQGIHDIIGLPDPIQQVTWAMELDDGLVLERISCPLGVLGVIFEARPDVIPQILSLAIKSGNAGILKGGQEAARTNQAFMAIAQTALAAVAGFPEGAYHLLESREDVGHLLKMHGLVDLIIPRGGNALVTFIQENTRIPVMGHADGICHLYVDRTADLVMAERIIIDAKTQYPSACNAVETVLVHRAHAPVWVRTLIAHLREKGVAILGSADVAALCEGVEPIIEPAEWHREFGDLRLAIKLVDSVLEAIEHINNFGSGHTDGIISSETAARDLFFELVDSAGVYHNASTRFADGFRYGLGAEVGISTNKTHARGPVGLEGLTIYKYRLFGSGHIVGDYTGPKARPFQHKRLI